MNLNFISENFIKFPNLNYHELAFYYLIKIDEEKYGYNLDKEYKLFDSSDEVKSKFIWIDIKDIENFNIIPNLLKNKIKTLNLIIKLNILFIENINIIVNYRQKNMHIWYKNR